MGVTGGSGLSLCAKLYSMTLVCFTFRHTSRAFNLRIFLRELFGHSLVEMHSTTMWVFTPVACPAEEPNFKSPNIHARVGDGIYRTRESLSLAEQFQIPCRARMCDRSGVPHISFSR